jgi:hypothetical protein
MQRLQHVYRTEGRVERWRLFWAATAKFGNVVDLVAAYPAAVKYVATAVVAIKALQARLRRHRDDRRLLRVLVGVGVGAAVSGVRRIAAHELKANPGNAHICQQSSAREPQCSRPPQAPRLPGPSLEGWRKFRRSHASTASRGRRNVRLRWRVRTSPGARDMGAVSCRGALMMCF